MWTIRQTFKGHSLSVSDVVVLHQNGQDTAHYCDSVGFQQVPEFLRENPLRTAELSTEQNEYMIDGVLNNAPSLGELEAKAKVGEQISLTDLAAAVKNEEKAPKAKKSRTAKPKKPSIRAQLDAAKKEHTTPPPGKNKGNGGLTMNFSVEEENLICMYHTSDRRRTMARMLTALPDMDTEMRRLANGTIAKLEHMTDADFDGQRFDFTGE